MSRKTGPRKGGDFAAAMRNVEPVGEARRRVGRRQGTGRARPATRDRAGGGPPVFRVDRVASCVYGLREDGAEALRDELRAGALLPANRLDLHWVTEEVARQMVFRFVRQARSSGLAVVAVVHGRGLRSPDGPVLKTALPGWLTEQPLARDVVAFGSAPISQGGDGVTLILLRGGEP